MAKASINFKAVKANSKVHNERLSELDYVYSDLSQNNEVWKSDEIHSRQQHIEQLCKELSGRKMQKNATPIREAVVNLNANHSMADLKELAKQLKEQKGVECFQIFIHRDEGKSRQDLNYHAHMVFDWQDKMTGKMKRLNKLDMSQIQTIVAESLHMERGELKENSNRQRLEPVEFKRVQEEVRLKELQAQVALEQKKNAAAWRAYEEARDSHKETQEQNEAHRSRFNALVKQYVEQGIQMDQKSFKVEANAVSRAIEWLEGKLAEQDAKGERSADDLVEIVNQINRLEKSPEYREHEKLEQQIKLFERIAQ